jgi:hypothetical protein
MPSLRHETALVTAMGGFTTACKQQQEQQPSPVDASLCHWRNSSAAT